MHDTLFGVDKARNAYSNVSNASTCQRSDGNGIDGGGGGRHGGGKASAAAVLEASAWGVNTGKLWGPHFSLRGSNFSYFVSMQQHVLFQVSY